LVNFWISLKVEIISQRVKFSANFFEFETKDSI